MAKKAKRKKKTSAKKPPAWKAFEQAVAQFVRTLDPTARVEENAKPPDVDTGRPRQRDVLVRAIVCQHFPVTILVSCKLKKRRLSEEDIDHFVGEMRSAGAGVGVIYATGFAGPAIEKARKLDISCCKLFQNAPAELPQHLIVRHYHCRPTIRVSVTQPIDELWGISTWGDLFAINASYGGRQMKVIDAISEFTAAGQRKSAAPFPDSWQEGLSITNQDGDGSHALSLAVLGGWRYYESRIEAHLLDGSYSVTAESFIGQQIGPSIDMWSTHPGDGWTELAERPKDTSSHLALVVYQSSEGVRRTLTEALSTQAIPKPLAQLTPNSGESSSANK